MNKDTSNSCGCSGGNGQQASCASEQGSTESTVFHVSNMDCRNEEALVRRTLENMPGVEQLEFDLPQRKLTVSHSLVLADALTQALNSVGMKAQAVRDTAVLTTYRIENMDCPSEEKLIRSHLGAVEGVQDLDFDLGERTLSVKHLADARAQMEQVLASIGMHAKEQAADLGGPAATAALVESPPAQPQPSASASTTPAGERVTYRIENMDCPTEEALIRDRLGKEPGVTGLDFNLMQRVLGVQHTLPSTEPIEKALASIGMRTERQDLQTVTTLLRIAKMDCPTEEGLIRGKLQGMPGVQGLDFNLMQRTLTVRHAPDAIKPAVEAIESLGMEAEVQKTDEPRDPQAPAQKTPWWPMAVSGIAAVLAEGVYWVNDGNHWAVIVLALVSIFTGGLSTYKKGWIALKNRNLNMNALMSIAVTGAMAIGHWPEAAMVMFLFALAEVIEAKSLDRARNAIRGLMDLAPETATARQPDGSWKEVSAKEIAKGAVVRVRPGERIALDGLITAGRSAINQAPITGESLPVEKAEGDQVFAGTINETGSFEYKVTAGASDSTLARIIHAVESAQGSRAPTQRFVDQFARVYTPAVFAVAVLVAVVPPLAFGGAWFDWIYKALVLLVVACPCALVISTPVTIVSGLAAAARRGILIKGGVYLEGGRKLKVLALDKTGTLTHGKPEQTDFVPLVGDANDIATWAASLAARSDHPVSQAIARRANRDGVALLEVNDFAALPGRGVRGRIAGRMLNMGNHRLAKELGLSNAALQAQLEGLERQGKTAILLMVDAYVLGIFAVADTVKESSREAVSDLQALGVRTIMLTGDNQHTADAIAAQVGISEARGDQLPEDKLKTVEGLIGGQSQVGMVGDGINDSPALARADIGFAMGAAGTDTAIETADVALMDDDLRKIPTFIRLSRTTASILTQNIVLALGIKAVFVALTFTGQATMWMAVFADMGASLLVVFNGLRLLKLKTA
ncbi:MULTISPECIES: heavy metal translocating P-type ATPase [Acidovorax]|uniref:P-type Zn(2+) transporter n=1 Tax=Acidovorax facilis TaxID=12917 RepID=A0ABV8DJQ5_9BURK|nr:MULTISPECIES: heavy metal translocating P-type ATPase [Acidovorax]KQB60265.1 ATPase P [Acidovorax sp. SD340]MBO1009605.1 heavy metal translocating P-type ATPase [Acidovorax sp. SD340]MCO4243740.1 heavy metal translocating P-type ATPase [Acidovorax facilis]